MNPAPEPVLRWLAERADRALVRVLLATLVRLPWIGPIVAFRLGDLQAALRGLHRWPGIRLAWQAQLRDKVDAMLAPLPPARTPRQHANPRALQRILYVVDVAPDTSRSGYALRTAALTDALRATGLQVQVTARLSCAPEVAAAPVSVFEPESAAIERHAAALARIIERERIDVVHAASPYANGHAANLAAARCGIPSVYEARGLWHRTRALREPLYSASAHHAHGERQELRACTEAALVIALSAPMADWMIAGGVPAARIAMIGNAAHALASQSAPRADDAPRLTLGYAGALAGYEGLGALLQLFAGDAMRHAHLLIAGDGPERAALQRLATRLGLGTRVRFLGVLPHGGLDRFYAQVDAIVLPRIDSGMTRMVPPLKPYDALAHKVPVLMSVAVAAAVGDELVARDDVSVFTHLVELPALLMDMQQRAKRWIPPPGWAMRARTLISAYRHLQAD